MTGTASPPLAGELSFGPFPPVGELGFEPFPPVGELGFEPFPPVGESGLPVDLFSFCGDNGLDALD